MQTDAPTMGLYQTETLVLLIPFRTRALIGPAKMEVGLVEQMLIPCLAVSIEGEVLYPDETFQWARLLVGKMPLESAQRRVGSVARLYQFWASVSKLPLILAEDVEVMVWAFLFERLTCPTDITLRRFPHWKPISFAHGVAEFAYIQEFIRFCSRQSDGNSVLGAALASASGLFERKIRKERKSDFLSHLSAQRTRWEKLLSFSAGYPKEIARAAGKKSTKRRREKTFSEKDVDAVINNETNLIYKMLWILLAYLGVRVSEALHLWRCDVLPGSYSTKFTDFSMEGVPFVIFAHPSSSVYTGIFDASASDLSRADFLKRFHRNPRTSPRPEHYGEKSGWKGMMEYDAVRQLRWGYWINEDRAKEFDSLIPAMNQLHIYSGTENSHPYFFINNKNANYRGLPSRMGNIEQAFEAACQRAGVRYGRNGYGLHSFRHFYKWYALRKLKIELDVVQEMMGHGSIESTRGYGQRAVETHNSLKAAMESFSWA